MTSKLKEIRLKKGYTLEKLSKATGLSSTYLNRIENGLQTNPSLDTIDKIANELDEDLVTIFYIIKNMNNY